MKQLIKSIVLITLLCLPAIFFGQTNTKVIGKPDIKLKSDLMTPEALWSLGRITEMVVSPDNTTIAFGLKYFDIKDNKGNTDVYTMSIDGKNVKQITSTPKSEFNLVWRPDGKKIGFIYGDDKGVMQIWEMNSDGSARTQITTDEDGITGFKYSPDSKKIAYSKELTSLVKTVKDKYSDLPKADARIIENLMMRHWDSWTDSYSHLFIADFDGSKLSNSIDINQDGLYDAPNKPFSGMEQTDWSPDSKNFAYSCIKKNGKEYAVSTNTDIYIYNLDSKKTTNLTEGMMGYDVSPVYSPDGKKIAWGSMPRDGYESDKTRLFVHDFATGQKTDLSKNFDQNAEDIHWSTDSKQIFFISGDGYACEQIFKADVATSKISQITKGIQNYLSVNVAGKTLIAMRQSMSMPTEIYSVNPIDGKDAQISFVNKDLLSQMTFGKVEERWVTTTDNKKMCEWVIYPPHFDKNKKYPTLLFCEGGPQSCVDQFWSYRWNMQIMAANGYIIVAPNRRGVPGFGSEWKEEISGDYGGQNMKDYLTSIDSIAREPFVNKDKLGCVGASYGGFSVYWLAGNHNKRFKAFIAHDGMFNFESQYLETEEMWFVNWDLGGPFWERNNQKAMGSYAMSPHLFVDKWDTPILCIHGGLDYRISYTQGMQAFTAAQLRNIPSKFLYLPEENHWVLQPQNGILWQREFFGWLDKWLK